MNTSMNSPISQADFDVIVCGGGMVGATLAALLLHEPALRGLRVALVEARFPNAPPPAGVDLRVSALSRAAERILSRCGAWAQLPPESRCAYQDMVVWDAASRVDSGAALQFSAAAMGEANLGYIVANNWVQWTALQAAAQAGVTRFASALRSIDLSEQGARVTLEDGRTLGAHLVVGADGANSASRACAGIATQVRAYQQTALVTHLHTARPHRHTAWQRFLPDGPIAFLPLNDGRVSMVWTVSASRAEALLKADDAQFAAAIGDASDHVLGDVTLATDKGAAGKGGFPLQIAQVQAYCRPRFVLVGDAAHSVHPLAGQGVNLGLMDAASLVQVLADARAAGTGIAALGELRVLRRYERWRKTENTLALGLVDGLNRLFSNDGAFTGTLRRNGLRMVEGLPLLKRQLMLRALGLAGERPRLVG